MKLSNNFLEIAKNYQYFVFDVWGVIHDGISAYPKAVETIKYLKSQGKKVCFLSNAPRRASKVAQVLDSYGITSQFYDFIVTSGEATYFNLEQNQKNNFRNFGKKYFYIGPEKDIDLLDGLDYEMTDAKNANFAITTGFDGADSRIPEKLPQINQALGANLELICVNPDMIVIRKNGDEMLCAGVIAKKYQELGGQVTYYGKPHQQVYELVHKLFGTDVKKQEIIAIGDGLETDIKGANAYGIDSILVTSGILSNKLGVKYNEMADEEKLQNFCDLEKSYPQYVIPNL